MNSFIVTIVVVVFTVISCKGVVAFIYVMLKIFTNSLEKTTEKDSDPERLEENTEEQTDINLMETIKSNSKSKKRKLKEKKGAMKFLKPKFNFFIAFQVNDVGIHQKVKQLQQKVINKNPSLFPALVNVSTLHVTLAVTHLANETDIKTIKDKLDDWAEKNIKTYFKEPCILNFSGVNIFKSGVGYIDIEQSDNYKKLNEISKSVNHVLSSSGFLVQNNAFTPHMTFLKLSKSNELFKLKKKFKEDFESLKECKEQFGMHEIKHLQLLSMNEPKDELGYYKCFHEIKLSEAKADMDHTECCSPILKPQKIS